MFSFFIQWFSTFPGFGFRLFDLAQAFALGGFEARAWPQDKWHMLRSKLYIAMKNGQVFSLKGRFQDVLPKLCFVAWMKGNAPFWGIIIPSQTFALWVVFKPWHLLETGVKTKHFKSSKAIRTSTAQKRTQDISWDVSQASAKRSHDACPRLDHAVSTG